MFLTQQNSTININHIKE